MAQVTEKPNNYPKTTILNPDFDPFSTTYDINGDGIPVSYTLAAKAIGEFSRPVAMHLAKHLANYLVFKRGIKTNYQAEYNQMYQTIMMEADGATT